MINIKFKNKISIVLGIVLIVLTQYLCTTNIYNTSLSNVEILTHILLMNICILLIVYSFMLQIKLIKFVYIFVLSPLTFYLQYLNEKMSFQTLVLLFCVILVCLVNSLLTRNMLD